MPATMFTPWYKYWLAHPIIQLEWVFEAGGTENLTNEGKMPGLFWLERRLGNHGELIGFSVHGDLKPAWSGVTLAPMGYEPVDILGVSLPPFSSAIENPYSTALTPLINTLRAPNSKFERLEGYFPVTDLDTGKLNIDRVQIFRLGGIVQAAAGASTDLAIVLLTLLKPDGSLRQNGGGTGPPKSP